MKGHLINEINFTEAEFKVLSCLSCRVTQSKVIGSILGSSPKTINTHIDNIKRKIQVKSKQEILSFIDSYKQINKLKHYFNKRYIDYKYQRAATLIGHRLSILNVRCIYNVSPELNEEIGISPILDSIGLLNIKLDEEKSLQNLLDSSSGLNTRKFGLLIVKHMKEIEHFQKHIGIVKNNIMYICLDDNKSDNENILFYDQNSKKELYHFLIKYLIRNYPSINDLNKETDFLASIDEIEKDIEPIDVDEVVVGNKVSKKISPIQSSQKGIFITAGLLMLLFGWYNYIQIKDGQFTWFSNAPSPTIPANKPILAYNLPSRNINFVGREDALQKIRQNLNKHKIGVITQAAVGSGGIGKTQLLAEYAYESLEKKEYEGVIWINAHDYNSIVSSYSAIADKFNIDTKNLNLLSLSTLIHQQLVTKQALKSILFVLDDVPKQSDIYSYISQIKRQLPVNIRTHILISSRAQNWTGYSLILDVFNHKEAKRFVKQHLPHEKDKHVEELIQTLNNYPLALGQAVGYIRQHSNIKDYLELYAKKQHKYLNIIPIDVDDYKNTLWSILDISLTKLSSHAKEMLFLASYLNPEKIKLDFYNSLTLEARGDAIKELKEHSLITLNDDMTSFKIHGLLQEVVRLKIYKQKQWIDKAANLAKAVVDKFNIEDKDTWDNAREWLFHIDKLSQYMDKSLSTADLLDKYGVAAEHFGRYELAREFLENSLRIQQSNYKKQDYIKLTDSLNKLGKLELNLAAYEKAKKYFQEVLNIQKAYYKNTKNINLSKTLNNMAMAELRLGNYNQAKMFYQNSMDIGKSYYGTTNHIKMTDILWGLGMVEWNFGYYEEARRLFQQALAIKDRYYGTPDHIEIVNILNGIGIIEIYEGHYLNAREIFERIIKIKKETNSNNDFIIMYPLQNLGVVEWSLGNFKKAKKLFQKSLKISQGHYRNIKHISAAFALQGLSLIDFSIGDYANARELLKRNLSINQSYYKSFEHISSASSIYTLGLIEESYGNYSEALEYIEKAYKLLDKYYGCRLNKVMLADYSPALNWPNLSRENIKLSISYYKKALDLAKNIFGNDYHLLARYNYLLGQAYEMNGYNNAAKQKYIEALNIAEKVAKQIKAASILIKHQENIEIIKSKLAR
ncbi:MAG: tetratricopeptide repeat protein [Legionellales bacterium]|nr:tetratricopeptide repeat protein [Legionellales bacterium]